MKITAAVYRARREKLLAQLPKQRLQCRDCRQPDFNCLCPHIEKVDAQAKFVILIHSIEAKKRVATGRLAHLCLYRSELITGHDFSQQPRINELLRDESFQPMVLYPGPSAFDLSKMEQREKDNLVQPEKTPLVFVIDGTWNTAKKMIRLSQNLQSLPRICFTPAKPSAFRVRKQPKANCFSTIEAIHQTLELFGPSFGFDTSQREHDRLLFAFDKMVEQQLEYVKKAVIRHVRHKPVA